MNSTERRNKRFMKKKKFSKKMAKNKEKCIEVERRKENRQVGRIRMNEEKKEEMRREGG